MKSEPVKFLLVDDIEENLLALEALLRRDGLTLLKARSGMEALELLLAHDVALALLDVQMPGMDGFELAELMRGSERTKHVPIIFVTAGNREAVRLFKGYESGAVDVLYKPIEPLVLKSKADVFFELYVQRREYALALQMNDLFVAILSHDLRNPLGTLVTGAELLEKQLSDQRQLVTLGRMVSAGRRMSGMIAELLDLTRARLFDGVGLARARERADVYALVQRAVEELRGAHPTRQIVLGGARRCVTTGDAERLVQVFSNLIGNALQHGDPSTPVTVDVGCLPLEVTVAVHNAGTIPVEQVSTLFDPFRRRDASRPGTGGLGLGLYISQQIARAHGGTIEVSSSLEAGTTFGVRLPRPRSDDSLADSGRPPKTVLVVEDDRDTRESLEEVFVEEGYCTITAADGREAIERLADTERRPDVVVLDIALPVMDGNRVYEVMRADPDLAGIPVVASTSTPERAPAGVVVVPKPLKLERLLRTVASLCETPSILPSE
jgi:two-component system, sensor histidine kinase and response regulator